MVYFRFMVIALLCLISACSSGNKQTPATPGTEAQPPQTTNPNEAKIQHLDIQVLESYPVQVQVVVQGQLPEACSQIDEVLEDRQGDTFTLKILVAQPTQNHCHARATTFERIIPLTVDDLKAGRYTVNVNGVREEFELTLDNRPS